MGKKFTYLLMCLFIAMFSIGFIAYQWPDNNDHVIFCNVGQGDSILISSGFFQMVIDTGPDELITECLKKHIPFWDKTIEVVLVTHADDDHSGGFVSLHKIYKVKKLYLTGIGKNTRKFHDFIKAVQTAQKQGTELIPGHLGEEIQISSKTSVHIIYPFYPKETLKIFSEGNSETQLSDILDSQTKKYKSINDESIVLFLTSRAVSYLFTGDLELPGELALINHSLLRPVTILKVGHHGSKSSTSDDFLQILRPEKAIISSGKNNRYGHPHSEVLRRLLAHNAQIFRTDILGTIEIINNEYTYWIKIGR